MGDLVELFGGQPFDVEGLEPSTPLPPETQALEAMACNGLHPKSVIMDGEIHRFGPDQKHWYCLYSDNVPAGTYGDWSGDSHKWCADIGRELTPEEKTANMRRLEEASRKRREAKEREYARAKVRAESIWGDAGPVVRHNYLERKHVSDSGLRQRADSLLVPVYGPDGEVQSLQFINREGKKKFLSGGKVAGGYFCLQGHGDRVYLAEGYATAATIHEETGSTVFAAFSAHNLPAVAKMIAERMTLPLVIVADNDESGTGKKYADKAAGVSGASVVMPPVKGDANDYHLGGGNLAELLEPKGESWLIRAADFMADRTPIRWLIKKWLPQESLCMVFGPPKSGKTFLTLDWALHVASDKEWNGNRTHGACVAYLCGEGHAGLKQRMAAWCQVHQEKDPNLYVTPSGCLLDTEKGLNHARMALRALPEPPKLIVVDTLHRFLAGDENSAQDAGGMVRACAELQREFRATVLLVHHSGNQTADRGRGSTAWLGALEVSVKVSAEGEIHTVEQKAMKDVECLDPAHFERSMVDLGWQDEDGDPVTSCVLNKCDPPPEVPKTNTAIEGALSELQAAWMQSGSEVDSEGNPLVSDYALEAYLTGVGLEGRNLTNKLNPDKGGTIGLLREAGIIRQDPMGWVVWNPAVVGQWLMCRG